MTGQFVAYCTEPDCHCEHCSGVYIDSLDECPRGYEVVFECDDGRVFVF